MTLTEFLLARIAEDEAAVEGISSGTDDADFAWWPDRIRAECAAKRHIVELRYSWNLQAEKMTEPPFGPILQTQVSTADACLRVLALPYSDHPDYNPEWRS